MPQTIRWGNGEAFSLAHKKDLLHPLPWKSPRWEAGIKRVAFPNGSLLSLVDPK